MKIQKEDRHLKRTRSWRKEGKRCRKRTRKKNQNVMEKWVKEEEEKVQEEE